MKANNDITFLIPLKDRYSPLVNSAVAFMQFILTDLSTDFSRSIYGSNMFDLDKIIELFAILQKNDGLDYQCTQEELLLIYSSHFLANKFGSDKEAFFKWFMVFEDGGVMDSDHFRKTMLNGQMGGCMVLEGAYKDNVLLLAKKKSLEMIFGELAEEL